MVSQSTNNLRVLIFGDDDFLEEETAAHRLVNLVAQGLELAGCEVSLSCDRRNSSLLRRALKSLRRTRRLTEYDAILYYGQASSTLLGLWFGTRRRTALISYVVEWPRSIPSRSFLSRLNAKLFCLLVFKIGNGAVVISRHLEQEAKKRNSRFSILRVPILCDPGTTPIEKASMNDAVISQVTYCADLDGYLSDAEIMIEAVAKSSSNVQLVMIGRASEETRQRLAEVSGRVGLANQLRIKSQLSDQELLAEYRDSSALLLPLDNSERARARFPIKLADYLLSGCPVVASPYGEPAEYLIDGVNSFMSASHSPEDYAQALDRALTDERREAVGRAGAQVARSEFDYRQQGEKLMVFIQGSLGVGNE